jgi:hypothetical protein
MRKQRGTTDHILLMWIIEEVGRMVWLDLIPIYQFTSAYS